MNPNLPRTILLALLAFSGGPPIGGDVDWLHTVYMVLAIAILFVTLLPTVRNAYKT
ncbi:MAG: hypothetical protein LH609_12925 [Rudanella sp.]|nr:hypothetical protein [Rudanella sp.]